MTAPTNNMPQKKKIFRTRKNHRAATDFDTAVQEVTATMPRRKRVFSSFIHSSFISLVSDMLGATIARPNAILFGAIGSFSLTLLVYLLAKNQGYSLSGSESVIGFLVGWSVGIIFDAVAFFFKKK